MNNPLAQILIVIWNWLTSILGAFLEWIFGSPIDPPNHPLRYFLPGKIILHVRHLEGITQGQIAADIAGFFQQAGNQQTWIARLLPPKPEDILTVPLGNDAGYLFSLVPVRLVNDKASHDDIVQLLLDMRAGLAGEALTISANLILSSFGPDWLVGTVHHGPHPPSPGSWPLEATAPREVGSNYLLSGAQNFPFTAEQGSNVHVAILDTAPTAAQLDEAYKRWPTHHLLERLWGSNRMLDLHTDIMGELELMDNSLVGHRYLMPDHGLFVAGIVNSIVPEARIHLIKVFTSFGSASTTTITQGIIEILNNREIGRPLIINCSFGLNIDEDSHLPGEVQGMITHFQTLISQLAMQQDILIVAAAGNYIKRGPRPEANYPAAFAEVIGVGALAKGPAIQVASYSNLADSPPDAGFMTFGGEPGAEHGVLGVYTSEFPSYGEGCLGWLLRILTLGLLGWKGPGHLPPNPYGLTINRVRYRRNRTGWAWWAGTSFAAPVVTAILAKWCSQQVNTGRRVNLADARRALTDMSQTVTTRQNEHVILVEQG
jgi:hypothetical protein